MNTDEWGAYHHVAQAKRHHVAVCHTPGQRVWARDDDGDGIRESHINTIEGLWTGVRNFLRPFRGINKIYLQQYLAIHERGVSSPVRLYTFFLNNSGRFSCQSWSA